MNLQKHGTGEQEGNGMNRAERRKKIREYAKYKDTEKCPLCNHKSFFMSIPTKEWLCDIKCEICNGAVIKDCKNLIPKAYVNLKSIMEENGNDR